MARPYVSVWSRAIRSAGCIVGLAVAGMLPDEIGAALITGSASAFVEAFQTTALACAAIVLIAAAGTAEYWGDLDGIPRSHPYQAWLCHQRSAELRNNRHPLTN